MKTKTYKVWRKVSTWTCDTYKVEIEDSLDDSESDKRICYAAEEEALGTWCDGDGGITWYDRDDGSHDEYMLEPSENGNNPTLEVYNNDGEIIWCNTPKEILRERKLKQLGL